MSMVVFVWLVGRKEEERIHPPPPWLFPTVIGSAQVFLRVLDGSKGASLALEAETFPDINIKVFISTARMYASLPYTAAAFRRHINMISNTRFYFCLGEINSIQF